MTHLWGTRQLDASLHDELSDMLSRRQWSRFYDEQGAFRNGFVVQVERELTDYFKFRYAVATTSGTLAIAHTLMGLDLRDQHVVVPAYAFAACPTAIIACGCTPVVAPMTEELLLDVDETLKLVDHGSTAVLLVHMRGRACCSQDDMERLSRAGATLVADLAQFDGLLLDHGPVDAAAISFQAKKLSSAGEGGASLYRTEDSFRRAFCAHDPAWFMRPQCANWEVPSAPVTTGGRMNEVSAMLLVRQLRDLAATASHAREIGSCVRRELRDRGVSLLGEPKRDASDGPSVFICTDRPEVAHGLAERAKEVGFAVHQETARLDDPHTSVGWPNDVRRLCENLPTGDGSLAPLVSTCVLQGDIAWSSTDAVEAAVKVAAAVGARA